MASFSFASAINSMLQGAQQAGQQIDQGRRELFERDQAAARRAEDLGFKTREEARAERRLGMDEERFALNKEKAELEIEDLKSNKALKEKERELAAARLDLELHPFQNEELKAAIMETQGNKIQLALTESGRANMSDIDRELDKSGLKSVVGEQGLKEIKAHILSSRFGALDPSVALSSGARSRASSAIGGADISKVSNMFHDALRSITDKRTELEGIDPELEKARADQVKTSIKMLENIISDTYSQLRRGNLTSGVATANSNRIQDIIDSSAANSLMNDHVSTNMKNISSSSEAETPINLVSNETPIDLELSPGGADNLDLGASPPVSSAPDMKPIKGAFVRTNLFGSSVAEQVAKIEIEKAILPQGPIDARQMQSVYKPRVNAALEKVDEWIQQAKQELGDSPTQRELTLWFRNKAGE